VSERPCIGVLWLLVVLPVVTIGCGREGRLPTAVTPPNDLMAAVPNLDARDERMLETMRGRGHQHLPPPATVAEAKEALGAVLTGEQAYYQKWLTFTDVPDTADFRVRWAFSVGGASVTGFVARAQGRDDTDAEGITVTLSYQREQPVVWAVQRRRPCR